jgi:hypothetical protein
MTYVSLNPEGMQKVITDLSGYAAKTREQHSSVASANERNDSPVELASYLQVIIGSASALEDKAKDLQARLDSAKAANESGITPAGVDGTLSYVIPDGQDDTAKNALANNNVEIANQARADAEKLKKYYAGDVTDVIAEGVQVFIDRMKANQSNPAYANVVLFNVDPKALRNIASYSSGEYDIPGSTIKGGMTFEQQTEVSNTLSNIVATASNTWSTERAKKYGLQLTEDMDDKGELGVNKLFSASRDVDIDGDGRNESVGLDYNDSMLVTVARRFEDLKSKRAPNERYFAEGGRFSGIVHAMTGNAGASMEWLTVNEETYNEERGPEVKVDQEATAERVKMLMNQGDVGKSDKSQWTDDWMLISAQSAVSNSVDEPSRGAGKAAIVSGILNTAGEAGPPLKLSNASINAASISLAANPYGVQYSTDLGNPSGVTLGTEAPKDKGAEWANDLPEQALFTNVALTNLAGQIGKNDLAKARLAASQEAFNRIQDDFETGGDAAVTQNYMNQSRTRGFIAGAIGRQAKIDGADVDKMVGSWAEAGAIAASAVPIPGSSKFGEGFGKAAAEFITNAGKSYVVDGAKVIVTKEFASNEQKIKAENEPIRDSGITACQQTVAWNLLGRGFYSQDELKQAADKGGASTADILDNKGEFSEPTGKSITNIDGRKRQQMMDLVKKAPEKGPIKNDFIDKIGEVYKSGYETAYAAEH